MQWCFIESGGVDGLDSLDGPDSLLGRAGNDPLVCPSCQAEFGVLVRVQRAPI